MQPSVAGFFRENYLNLVILIGTFSVLSGNKKGRRYKNSNVFLYVAAELFVALVLQYIERYYGLMETHSYVRNFLCACSYFLYPLMLIQTTLPVLPEGKKVRTLLWIPFFANTIHCILILFNLPIAVHYTSDNHFSRGILGFLPFAVAYFYLIILVIFFYRFFRTKHTNALNLLIYVTLSIVISSLLEMKGIVFALNTVAVVDILLFNLFTTLTLNAQAENEKLKLEMQLYHSQIQPHFIFNSLAAIRSYLPEDSKAREVMNHFAGFLRGVIDLLSENNTVPASREFATAQNYLYMIRTRYGDRLEIFTDFQDEGFELPTFTVQTLVENAMRHGIRYNEDGRGRLQVRSYETEDYHIVEVEDNGVGFDVEAWKEEMRKKERFGTENDRTHIGLTNLEHRLEILSKGRLEISSRLSEGTLVRGKIPKDREKH